MSPHAIFRQHCLDTSKALVSPYLQFKSWDSFWLGIEDYLHVLDPILTQLTLPRRPFDLRRYKVKALDGSMTIRYEVLLYEWSANNQVKLESIWVLYRGREMSPNKPCFGDWIPNNKMQYLCRRIELCLLDWISRYHFAEAEPSQGSDEQDYLEGKTPSKKALTPEEREKAIQKCLDEKITGRNAIARKTGISQASVSRSRAWKARDVSSDQARIRAVSANEMLSRLMADQNQDYEPSPLAEEGKCPRSHLYQTHSARDDD